jgi:hypothetical protein
MSHFPPVFGSTQQPDPLIVKSHGTNERIASKARSPASGPPAALSLRRRADKIHLKNG